MDIKYSDLLVNYSLKIKPRQQVLVVASTAAESFLPYIYESLLKQGAYVDFQLIFENSARTMYDNANPDQLAHVSPLYCESCS